MIERAFTIDASSIPEHVPLHTLAGLPDGQRYVRFDTRHGAIDGVFKRSLSSNKLVVLFPAALTSDDVASRRYPSIPRWSWVEDIDANVWCFEEAIARKYQLAAGWFQERDHFHADVVADLIARIAVELLIAFPNVSLMGSSLGGFGALMVAAKLPGSLAIADIAQTDLATYQFQNHIAALCSKIYNSNDVRAINEQYRDRFSVIERFRRLGHIPDMIVLHELTDEPNGVQQIYSFLTELAHLRLELSKSFLLKCEVRCVGNGHRPIHKVQFLDLMRAEQKL